MLRGGIWSPGQVRYGASFLGRFSSNQLAQTFHSSPVGNLYSLTFVLQRETIFSTKTVSYKCGTSIAVLKFLLY
jgi:hypothetical protein